MSSPEVQRLLTTKIKTNVTLNDSSFLPLFKAASAKRSLLGIAFVVVVVVLSAIFQKMIDSHHRSYNTLLHHLEKTIQVS